MKKIIAIALTAIMLLSLTCVFASAEEVAATDLVEIENVHYVTAEKEVEADVMIFDKEMGNNDVQSCQKGVLASSLYTKNASGDLVHGETVTAKTYSTPFVEGATIPYATAKLKNGEELQYLYGMRVTLKAASNVNEVKFYMQGYKPSVLDRQFSVLVSADGTTWEKVFSAGDYESLVNETTGLLSDEGLAVYVGAINVPGAKASAADAATCVTVSFDTVKNVKYVMWTSNATRFNNSHYTARFTEVAVYSHPVAETTVAATTAPAPETKAPETTQPAADPTPATGDKTIFYVIAAAVVAIACTVVVIRRKED